MVSLQASGVCIILICITTVVQSQVYHVTEPAPGKFRIENVVDGDLTNALRSIRNTWKVESLDLSGNVLSNLDGKAFEIFENLKVLKLATNVLSGDIDVSSLRKLEKLDINKNYVSRVTLGSSVKDFSAVRNNITSVDCKGPQYGPKKFILASNKINQLKDLASECRRDLEELNLELNDIDIVDFADLYQSQTTLKLLNLRYNFIYDIKTTGNLTFRKLTSFDLKKNKLAFMSAALNAAPNAHIDLSNNKLVLIDEKLNIPALPSLNLTGNEFQCQTLKAFLQKYPHYAPKTPELCGIKRNWKGICCEDLNAPFADRLIALKRREQSLFNSGNPEEDQKQCEEENQERERMLNAILDKFKTQVDKAVQQKQEKATLNVRKKDLETALEAKQEILNELKSLVQQQANSLNLDFNEDTLQMIDGIVQHYEERYNNEQYEQRKAIKDLESLQKMIEQQLEEKERLEKLNADADIALQRANATLTDLQTKQANLSKILSERNKQ